MGPCLTSSLCERLPNEHVTGILCQSSEKQQANEKAVKKWLGNVLTEQADDLLFHFQLVVCSLCQ